MVKHILIIILPFVVFTSQGCAQGKNLGESKSKKANKYFEQARLAFRSNDIGTTLEYLDKAVEEDQRFAEAIRMQGVIYFDLLKDNEKAIDKFEQLSKIDSDYDPTVYLKLGEAYFHLEEYEEAKSNLERFLKYESKENLQKQAGLLIKNCEFAPLAKANPVPYKIEKLGSAVNSLDMEYFPALTADQEYLYFTRQRGKGKYAQEDIFYAQIAEDGNWAYTELVDGPVNTPHSNEGAHTISPDGKFLIFTSCDKADSYGGCDLYITKKVGEDWGVPKNLGSAINSGSWETQPSISSDSRALYFVSNRKGGFGRSDIYVSYLGPEGFGPAENLGPAINTFGEESRPFIHPDNQTLYFASNGHPGMGESDIFFTKNSSGIWSEPKNLGYPINTKAEEPGIFVSTDGKYAYFASDIEEKGNLDIYRFVLPESSRPANVTYFKAKTFDAVSEKPLSAFIQIVDAESGEVVNETLSDPVNGTFMICLIEGKDYLCNVSKENYLFYSENFLLGQHDITEPYVMDIPMKKFGIGKTIVLKNIFFETGEYVLKESSLYELEKLKRLLDENPLMKIEISGHTDNVGSKEDNIALSRNRARAVYDYLVDNEIAVDRLSYKGYGEEKPIADNDTESGRAKNRRTEFTILQM